MYVQDIDKIKNYSHFVTSGLCYFSRSLVYENYLQICVPHIEYIA